MVASFDIREPDYGVLSPAVSLVYHYGRFKRSLLYPIVANTRGKHSD